MNKSKTVLFAPLDSLGHINSLVSIANDLKSHGHRTVFLFIEPIDNNLKQKGHEVYDSTTPDLVESISDDTAQLKWNEIIKSCQQVWQTGDVIRNLEFELDIGFGTMISDIQKYNDNIESKVALIKPDIIVLDHYFGIPALFKSQTPWIRIYSASPLALHHQPDNLPQPWLGLATTQNFDKADPKHLEYNERALKARQKVYDTYNAYWTSFGLPDLPTKPVSYVPKSPYLNIYMYPEELDYSGFPLKDWQRCDCMVRSYDAAKLDCPETLRNKPGKLIFLSMGSLASADILLMKRLTSMLADSPNRFIVAKGPLHDQYELPENMWGQMLVPQLEVLRAVDLIITHGGNNTVTEAFYYGVPGFIVCPLFGDQFDNATRIQEKGLGIRLDPYNCSKEELLNAIESMLVNKQAEDTIKGISARMKQPEACNRSIKLVRNMVARH